MNKIKLLTLLILCSVAQAEQGSTGYLPDPLRHIGAQHRHFPSLKGAQAGGVLPQEFDLRKFQPVVIRDQGNCGSCYAAGSKGAVEFLIRLRDKKDTDIALQWAMDCSGYSKCGGGDFKGVLNLFKVPKGIAYTSEYGNYTQRSGSCRTPSAYHEQLVDWGYVTDAKGNSPKVSDIQRAIFELEAPVGVTTAGGSISTDNNGWVSSCRGGSTNHIEYIAGWLEGSLHGKAAGPYWIVVNSWGSSYGDNGVAYIPARDSFCSGVGEEEVVYLNYKPACLPQPKVDAGPDQVIVLAPGLGHSVQLGGAPQKDLKYAWSPAVGLSNASVAQPVASPSKTTVYTVKASSDCGEVSASVKVRVFGRVNGAKLMEMK